MERPVVLISGFKAGTWLMRKIMTEMTGMPFYEPEIIPGERKYYNPDQLRFVEGHYYSWHLVPTPAVVERLNGAGAKTLFVVRNVYDLVLSIYHHFYDNIDEDIGRGAGKHHFLGQFTLEEGLSLIITGFDENGVRWNGMGEVLDHYNEIFKAAQRCDALILNYDTLVEKKADTLKQIAAFLGITVSAESVDVLERNSSFGSMKERAEQSGVGASHFREGKASSNKQRLSPVHRIQLRQMMKLLTPDLADNARAVGMEAVVAE